MPIDEGAFLEEQRFLSKVVAGTLVGGFATVAWIVVARGRLSNLIGVAAVLALVAIFAVTRLIVRVLPDSLDVEFRPFVHRRIPLAEISRCEARKYRPILEYGGWGLRWGWKGGRAYNVRGNRGVQLSLRNGEAILLGSQRAEELASVIRHGMQSA